MSYRGFGKRALDLLVSIVAAPFALLILLPAMLAIALEDGFPVFYNATRIGKAHKPFRMFKLRSMKKHAPDLRMADGSTYNSAHDPRLTKVGGFLRKTSIDELPQLLNVFLGQMSLIGPRPDLPDEAARYTAEEAHRLDVRPGITGYSQAYFRNDITYAEKYKQDVYYARNLSFRFDCRILLQTVRQVFSSKGVYAVASDRDPDGVTAVEPRKKLALISCHAPSVMGFRLDMMQDFIAHGYDVTVFAPDDASEWEPRFAACGVAYVQIGLEKNGTNPFRDLKGMGEIKKRLLALAPDAVFCDHAKGVIYGVLAAKQAGVKRITAMIAGAGSILRGEDKGLKARLVRAVLKAEYRVALVRADTVFFQNGDDAKLFCDAKLVTADKIVFVPGSGVRLDRFAPMPMPQDRRFLFVGRLIGDKGLREYLECAKEMHQRHPDCVFDVVGYFDTNTTAMQLSDLTPYVDAGAVRYAGYHEDVRPFLSSCYAFVLPSYHEGTPRAVLEAMAVGRPIVTTDAPGCRETVQDGENGFLAPVRDVAALVQACDTLYSDAALAQRMGERSRAICAERFDVNIVNQRIRDSIDKE